MMHDTTKKNIYPCGEMTAASGDAPITFRSVVIADKSLACRLLKLPPHYRCQIINRST